jgi:hypothetical protein
MKTKTITLDKGTFVIKEPTVGVLFPIMDLMEKDPKAFQMELIKGALFQADGVTPVGEGLMDFGLGDYMALVTEVVEVAGLAGSPKI